MKRLITTLALMLLAAPAFAGQDSTDRYWSSGPAWYDIPCGLACFRLWEDSGLGAGDASLAQLKHVRTPAEMRSLIEAHRSPTRGEGEARMRRATS
ncbi:MAG TPA: hypothetical protein VGF58_10550 [Burkholderiales bacterium]|jgi:hypothetical protein